MKVAPRDAFVLTSVPVITAASLGQDGILASESFAVYEALTAAGRAAYAPLCDEALQKAANCLYVPTLDLPDRMLDDCITYVSEHSVRLAVQCASTLEEVGRIDGRFGKSPVMLLHEFGLLEYSAILGGVYLDKEDLALMAQENVPLIVLPSSDAGSGRGVAPIRAALDKGVEVRIGTGDGRYNRSRNVLREAALLRVLVSAQMNIPSAVTAEQAAIMCVPRGACRTDVEAIAAEIENL